MSVFDTFPTAIMDGYYWKTDQRNSLGVSKSDRQTVKVIIDEGTQTAFGQNQAEQTDDVLIYAQPGSPLATHACIGGYVQVLNGLDKRTFKLTRWDVGRDQDTNTIDHYEVYGQEVGKA